MPKIHHLKTSWPRVMPIDAFLRIGEEFEAMADHDPTPLIQADLRDGSKLRAGNVKELRQELATESVSDIVGIAVGFGKTAKAQTWLTWDKEPGALRLRSEGQDEAKVHGIYGPVMRRIENRLEAIDRGDTESQGPLMGADPVARSIVTVGSITAGSVAVSGPRISSIRFFALQDARSTDEPLVAASVGDGRRANRCTGRSRDYPRIGSQSLIATHDRPCRCVTSCVTTLALLVGLA